MSKAEVIVVGGGLAGSESAYYLASHGVKTTLVEMKPKKFSPAHESANFGELVCSNSLKSNDLTNACGLLKEEMRILGSLTMQAAEYAKVPAGSALAVDREKFSAYITEKLQTCENLTLERREVKSLSELVNAGSRYVIIATGPLTSDELSKDIQARFGNLHFYDASAPIVSAESIDPTCSFTGDRYGKGTGDYINCPLSKDEYYAFVENLLSAEKANLHEFEKGEIFEGCMPIEVMASRGKDTLRYGTLKPVGLFGEDGKRPYAVLQLRKENENGTAYNLVGCQTNLKFPEQKRVFSMIPALKNAEFLRYGVMHRNTFIESPSVLNRDFSVKNNKRLYFAGQITGVEGYVESAASGLLTAIHLADEILGREKRVFDGETVCGALENHISTPNKDFQPMNANFGILDPLPVRIKDKKERYATLANRAIEKIRKLADSQMQTAKKEIAE
ncbi:MAG: methylenetetrahydrofolate--tRNA-(uracil(54)-C(5))-methyltransferase (FADH(2)-oxidizing) TrmFO [Clostridia bacterium]|nr:methylenetetrahydrofolate--tRNA-(uracil(54)-C(5))-methyltransferase (FADH(2)-oxidizing) TrmFO [Clostridia bacterium]